MGYYEVESSRVYAAGERYCSGSGLSALMQDRTEAEALFHRLSASTDYVAAVELRHFPGDGSVVVLARSGPSMLEAKASMHRAYRARRAEAA